MSSRRLVRDPEEARDLWKRFMPEEYFSDLWEVREAFDRQFRRPILFILQENGAGPDCFLPLSWIEEQGHYSFFPGETWHGRTWLEQNLIPGPDPLETLLSVPGPCHLRYLSPRTSLPRQDLQVDEIGYLFKPPEHGYDMNNYFALFSGKSLKRIRREVDAFEAKGITWRLDRAEDISLMVSMNIARFGIDSYFYDPRFKNGFMAMLHFFRERGRLRVTSVLVGGEIAAVDVGIMYRGVYTLVAGGTNPSFPGIAKLINLHHMRRACEDRVLEVDFLCGDFNWKKMFHLMPRPLYLFSRAEVQAA